MTPRRLIVRGGGNHHENCEAFSGGEDRRLIVSSENRGSDPSSPVSRIDPIYQQGRTELPLSLADLFCASGSACSEVVHSSAAAAAAENSRDDNGNESDGRYSNCGSGYSRLGIVSRDEVSSDQEFLNNNTNNNNLPNNYRETHPPAEDPCYNYAIEEEETEQLTVPPKSRVVGFSLTITTIFEESEEEEEEEEEEEKQQQEESLSVLRDVTEISRSLISQELIDSKGNPKKWNTSLRRNKKKKKMTTRGRAGLGSFRKRLSRTKGSKSSATEETQGSNGADEQPQQEATPQEPASPRGRASKEEEAPKSPSSPSKRRSYSHINNAAELTKSPGGRGERGRRSHSADQEPPEDEAPVLPSKAGGDGRPNMFQRLRERSRSRSATRRSSGNAEDRKEMLVAVTSCRSDGYYNQKAPGSTSKLPRKAPTNLKLFHELAVGVKDAYAAVGATPRKPSEDEASKLGEEEYTGRSVLWDFVGNLDFLLALVDEVSVDTVTRGALKDDQAFKGLRDVIKKGNRVLEEMLVRRERKYTLFFRLVQPHDVDQIERMKNWNSKVEKAVGAVTDNREPGSDSSSGAETESLSSASSQGSSVSSRAGVFSRGRQLLPTAGRVRSRRATPTPRLRKHHSKGSESSESESDTDAAQDGFSAETVPTGLEKKGGNEEGELFPTGLAVQGNKRSALEPVLQIQPKDELVDVIRGLRVEKIQKKENSADDELAALKPNWCPKSDIPSAVPKLPTEYVHRHRLMKQVVSCLLDENEPQVSADGVTQNTAIACVTSRHGDKAGNGKSTLAIAVIQTVEVRERFCDGIAWLKLGRGPLSERDVRRLYEDLYRQLVVKEADMDASMSEDQSQGRFNESMGSIQSDVDNSESGIDRIVERADSVRRFQGGDLEGIKEDLGRMLIKQKVLICLDDVWRVEDAKWFIFETPSYKMPPRDSPFKILITTRTPSLVGNGIVPEVFVRILSEHEAVKLLLSTAGRRPYGGRSSEVFNQSRLIVKGCGNSPLGILLVGSMLRHSNRNWNLKSPVWNGIFNQCSLNLEEAAQLRSFKNAFTRIVDMCFFTIEDTYVRIVLRRCFVIFVLAFRANDWMLSGRGIPQSVVLQFFETVIVSGPTPDDVVEPVEVISVLEHLKLIQRARHSVSSPTVRYGQDNASVSSHGNGNGSSNGDNSEKSDSEWDEFDELPKRPVQQFYTMHDSLKAVAELMSERPLPAFTPEDDNYTFFSDMISEENRVVEENDSSWSAPLRYIFKNLSRSDNGGKNMKITDERVHEIVVISIVGGGGDGKPPSKKKKASIVEAMAANQFATQMLNGGDKFEEYSMAFLPDHLKLAKAYSSVGELLTDPEFVRRRVFALGIMEATGRQVADILDLRSLVVKGVQGKKAFAAEASPGKSPKGEDSQDLVGAFSLDIDATVCEASRMIVDEVYKVTNSMGSSDSLGMATCLATVGEELLKCRQPRDAMLRLEEAVSIYRGLLGPFHVFTAHALQSVAKALVKLGETRVALLKFAEAARIYEACNATLHYDSIANAQSLASLLVDIGDIRKAESMFEEVISMKQTVYGENSVPVAKTINSYAILLAKHGRMNDALKNYDIAKSTYRQVPQPFVIDPEFEVKCNYDVTLITLNIASIYSKRGDLERALACYEEGVHGLNEYEAAIEEIRERNGSAALAGSSHKHLVAALGRIGSLKMKLGDNDGALNAYLSLVNNVDEDSPLASHVEEAKAHIKCATLFRQREDPNDQETAVQHLREAFRMYKALYGPEHKDTVAIHTSLKQWLAEDKEKHEH